MPLTGLPWIFDIDGEVLDLSQSKVSDFRRLLNMKEGYLERSFTAELAEWSTAEDRIQTFLQHSR